MKKYLIVLILTLINIHFVSRAEENFYVPFSLGLYGGINVNMHSPSFALPQDTNFLYPVGYQDMGFKDNSSDIGFNIGGMINVPINETFVFSGRLGYNGMSGSLSQDSAVLNIGTTQLSMSDLDATISYLEISPMMQFHNLLPLKRLYFLAGLEFGIPLSGSYDLSQTETSGSTTIIRRSNGNDINDMNVRFALGLGAGYTFNLSESVFLSPELSYRLPFTDVSSHKNFDSWSIPQLRMGVNLTFGFGEKKKEVKDESYLDLKFNEVNYYDKDGTKKKLEKITVEEIQYKELFPLVPYVFYKDNQSIPTEDYDSAAEESIAGEFNVQNLKPEAVSINSRTLDIIGARMNQYPDATLEIAGTNDETGELANTELSLKRAEYAKNYLVVNYGISPDRISLKGGGMPAKPSAKKDPDGIAENRRVEFASNKPEILEPIIIQGDKVAVANPDNLEVVTEVVTKDSITSWVMEIYQSDKLLKSIDGTGNPGTIKWQISTNEIASSAIPLELNLKATTSADVTRSISTSIPVDFLSTVRKKSEDKPDQTISKFSLILFDFDSDVISDADKKIIEQHVIPEIKFNSTVRIYGYTDRIGNEDYNYKLAAKRANSVKTFVEEKGKPAKVEVYGVGEKAEVYDNNSPIGRQLSRTVQIYVITPKS